MLKKSQLRSKFAKDWEKHYKIQFLIDNGFKRKVCPKCGKGFWTMDDKRTVCGDQPCQAYTFLGNPPTNRKLDYIKAWQVIEDFFKKSGHESVRRYPVVCRWRPDLFFTVTSIIDFHRVEKTGVVFQFPSNPLVVPQMCLRFNDIPNVGITGRHYTAFCMVGQHSLYTEKEGYWKEKCIELDYNLLKHALRIKPEEIVFVEDLWVGPGAFGPSLEYFVRGLEVGNAVFTEFLETQTGIKEMKGKVVDMGAGLERFAWITQGTPTSYDVTFKPILEILKSRVGIKYDENFFLEYSKLAGTLNIDEVRSVDAARRNVAEKLNVTTDILKERIEPLEALYAICDHTLALTFSISDGLIPSNVGGGYNLRVVLRRALNFIDKFRWNLDLAEICEMHSRHLKPMYPELSQHTESIRKILDVEKRRYYETKKRTEGIVKRIVESGEELDEERLVKLYDSEGITPESIKDYVPDLKVPSDFYTKVTERHMERKEEKPAETVNVETLPKTQLLYYENQDQTEFQAKVLKVIDGKWLVLDKTCFYPEGGGQQSDQGFIGSSPIINVQKVEDVVLHRVSDGFDVGRSVEGKINIWRRQVLTKHHTATHIINISARMVLGNHVWQHGAEKTTEKARLDITHYQSLTDKEVGAIEKKANDIVKRNLPVNVQWLPRQEAEEKYGFTIYQGGVVPGDKVRVISIGNMDHEACGGLQTKSTKDVGFISILRTKRIQDGIVRIEFVCGDIVEKSLKEKEKLLEECAKLLKVKPAEVPDAVGKLFEDWKTKRKENKKR